MRQKKGQITIYLIIGIIALVSVGIFLYIRGVEVEAPASYSPTIDQIPVEAEPIRQFVSSCIGQVAEDGLRKVGTYGGYASVDDMGAQVNPFFATQGNAVQFSPGSELVVPYWWHMDASNNCEKSATCSFASKRPNLFSAEGEPSVEGQLDKYVNENLRECLSGFSEMEKFGFVISETGNINTKTVVTKKTVAFLVKYPLTAKKADVTYNINEYFVEIPLNLKDMYELATEISNLQAKFSFLENFMINVLSVYRGVDEDALPPITASGFDTSGGVFWIKSEVEEKVFQIFQSYTPMLRVTNTQNFRAIDFPEGTPNRGSKIATHNSAMHVAMPDASYPNLAVYFSTSSWWKPFFNLNCDGELCKPNKVTMFGDFTFFMQNYLFAYDFSVPVLVTIDNPDAFNMRGYSFQFFLESNVRDNVPVSQIKDAPLPLPKISAGSSMLCDENKRNSPNISIFASDAISGEGLEEAFIMYKCGKEQCNIGKTGEDGWLVTRFPVCAGGQMEIAKEGYQGMLIPMNTHYPEPFERRFTLQPYLEKDIKIMKYKYVKVLMPITVGGMNITTFTWQFMPTPLELTNKERAIVTLTRRQGDGELPFIAAADYSGDKTVEDNSKGMRIIPGMYDIEIFLMTKEKIVIPEDEICGEILGIEFSCEKIKSIEFGPKRPLFSGGVKLSNVPLMGDALRGNDLIVFKAISIALEDMPSRSLKHEDMEKISAYEALSTQYKRKLMPTYEAYPEEIERGNQSDII